jgi:3-hydroxybutyryl-CoA dehydratase
MFKLNESLAIGYTFKTASRTLTEADIVNFAGLSNDWDPLHIDQTFAETGPFGRRIAHGQLTAAIVTGLGSELDTWPLLGYMGTSRRFSSPVGAGDTFHGVYTVKEVRPTSANPNKLVVTLGVAVIDQLGNEVIAGEDIVLVDGTEQLDD